MKTTLSPISMRRITMLFASFPKPVIPLVLMILLMHTQVYVAQAQLAATTPGILQEKDNYTQRTTTDFDLWLHGSRGIDVIAKNDNNGYFCIFKSPDKKKGTFTLNIQETGKNLLVTRSFDLPLKGNNDLSGLSSVGTWSIEGNIIALFLLPVKEESSVKLLGWIFNRQDFSVVKENILLGTFPVDPKSSYRSFITRSPDNAYMAFGLWESHYRKTPISIQSVCFNKQLQVVGKKTSDLPQLQRDFELGNAVVDNKGIIYTLLSGAEDNKHDDPCKLVQIGHSKPVVTDITCNDKILLHGKLEIKEDNRLYFAALARDPGGKNLTGIFLTELADGKQAAPLSYTFTPELLRKVDKQDADQAISKGSKAGLLPFFEVVKIGKRDDGSIDVLTAYTEYYGTTLMKDGRFNSIGNDNQRYYRLGDLLNVNCNAHAPVVTRIPRMLITDNYEMPREAAYSMALYHTRCKGNHLQILYTSFEEDINKDPENDAIRYSYENGGSVAVADIDEKGNLKRQSVFKLNEEKSLYVRPEMYSIIDNAELVLSPYRINLNKKMKFRYLGVKLK